MSNAKMYTVVGIEVDRVFSAWTFLDLYEAKTHFASLVALAVENEVCYESFVLRESVIGGDVLRGGKTLATFDAPTRRVLRTEE